MCYVIVMNVKTINEKKDLVQNDTFRVVNVMLNLKHYELLLKMPCICKFKSFA